MGLRRRDRDLVGLTVLALLSQGPRHAYDMHRFVVDTHKDFVTGLPRSLYHAVDRLAKDELIAPVETTREGRRPERTIYEITGDGRGELGTRLRHLLETPDRDTTPFVAALSFMGCLAPLDTERALVTRSAALDGAIRAADEAITGLTETRLPRLLLIELEFERARAAAELEWVRDLVSRIRSGEINWGSPCPNSPDVRPDAPTSGRTMTRNAAQRSSGRLSGITRLQG